MLGGLEWIQWFNVRIILCYFQIDQPLHCAVSYSAQHVVCMHCSLWARFSFLHAPWTTTLFNALTAVNNLGVPEHNLSCGLTLTACQTMSELQGVRLSRQSLACSHLISSPQSRVHCIMHRIWWCYWFLLFLVLITIFLLPQTTQICTNNIWTWLYWRPCAYATTSS